MLPIPREIAHGALRANLPLFAAACIASLAGVSALLLWRMRSRDRLLLWVGLFSVLYGARLLLENDLVRAAFDIQASGYRRWDLCITYAINIPYVLFARELIGRGWKCFIGISFWVFVAFAACAIPATLLTHPQHWLDVINNTLVVSGTVVLLAHVLAARRSENELARSLLWPLLIFGIFVLLENKGIRPGGLNIEPIGFLVLLGGLASIAARRALERERKLIDVEQELATARRIQISILPQTAPELLRLRIAARYQPMTSVAGDFYDFLRCGDRLLTILVADVSGHGVPAALVASMLKVCFAAQRDHAHNPAAILAGLNRMLRGSLAGQYITAACAAIDTETGTITYAGAGHPPALLLRKNSNEIMELAENGLFLGPFPNASYSNISAQIARGDSLLLYTDGILEARLKSGQEFGSERLSQFLLTADRRDPAEFLEQLFQAVSVTDQQDDLTAVLTQYE